MDLTRPSAQLLLSAYAQGIFPMAHPEEEGRVYWYAPDPRAILPLDGLRISRRFRQTLRKKPYEIRFNTDFEGVIEACAEPRPDQPQTWISEGIKEVYTELHHLGFAHSVEAWEGERLVGGLYGVALGGLFAGESMFHRATDASKICLVHLVERLKARGFSLLDVQFQTSHLERFGVIEISREAYEAQLSKALTLDCAFA
ncbi:leucyl/phenylalanyl-tRNA--protein transferase [Bradymonadaceae bacterium TMQ3]|uniref:Leucyl/phenylalanyl-tRNA--protein transferase n=1 Tax=Lujinxingia sediminis TaxID=2480984 RepID=A0ABY0CNF2_9DELT|nr:leucyl/phenylalanyl-tRNA--protein transferase [Lujinxingia sediminis]RDV36371.1 leucyl/phenylalanyl-tRNA--protein transferase [Bradymonadaceae bacterium TMQ3]RVU41470.1 leucyl/phenylalanyl-tRNA--protein transferase [Lujinxingia sediminis]TXC68460.1 leucyl/phenylalanyl-tRNA--protein transferase [Bradymonadales bacterium TMQ1]